MGHVQCLPVIVLSNMQVVGASMQVAGDNMQVVGANMQVVAASMQAAWRSMQVAGAKMCSQWVAFLHLTRMLRTDCFGGTRLASHVLCSS